VCRFWRFAARPGRSLDWNESGWEGMARFLGRLWWQVHRHVADGGAPALDAGALSPAAKTLRRQLHETIQKVGDDYGRRHTFNTAIAAVMELLNALAKFDETDGNARALRQEAFTAVTLLPNPITPHAPPRPWQVPGPAGTTAMPAGGARKRSPP